LVLIADAHWMDRASDGLVGEIAAAVRGTRTLLLANFRPEYRPAWIGGSHYHQLALSPLGEEAGRELLRDLLGLDNSLGELGARILERTGGNPFFTEEVVQALAASGSLVGERRARLHAAVATALETLRADRLGEYASLIAHHWEASGMRFEAARWKRRAALNVANIKVSQRRRRRTP